MPQRRLIAAALAASLLMPAVAGATATEAVRSAASTTVRAVEKAGDAVAHGVGVAADKRPGRYSIDLDQDDLASGT